MRIMSLPLAFSNLTVEKSSCENSIAEQVEASDPSPLGVGGVASSSRLLAFASLFASISFCVGRESPNNFLMVFLG